MKFVEQTKFVTNGELEKHNTLRGLNRIQSISGRFSKYDMLISTMLKVDLAVLSKKLEKAGIC